MAEQLLDGQAVVVTGAGRGLGRAYALALAREGAAVVVNDIDVEEANQVVGEIRAGGGRAIASGESVADWDASGRLIGACIDEFGAIDGLVNNAVAYGHFGAPWEETPEKIRRQVDVAVVGTIFCGTHAMRHMVERKRGNIVNVSSRIMIGVGGMGTYCATKGAIASLTYSWAVDLIPFGIRVNALAPGAMTRANQMSGAVGSFAAGTGVQPEVIAPAVVYLLSRLSRPMTGQVVALMGGKFGMIQHPRLMDGVEHRPEWTARSIAELVERDYSDRMEPVGVEALGPADWTRLLDLSQEPATATST